MPVNTGYQEKEQIDVNPNSPTVGQKQWVAAGYNTTACPLPATTYYSKAISETVYRTDCGAGTSTGVTYTVAAGHVASTQSQLDADTAARDYFNSSKEAFAQANASCVAPPTGGGGSNGLTCQKADPQALQSCWTGYMVDSLGNTFIPTPEQCQECNASQPPTCLQLAC